MVIAVVVVEGGGGGGGEGEGGRGGVLRDFDAYDIQIVGSQRMPFGM